MKILAFEPALAHSRLDILRACRLLGIEFLPASGERQLIRLSQELHDDGDPPVIIARGRDEGLIRELHARVPRAKVMLTSMGDFDSLSNYLARCPLVFCFLFSHPRSFDSEFFVSVFEQISFSVPLESLSLLGRRTSVRKFDVSSGADKADFLREAKDFIEWALGDAAEGSLRERCDQLLAILDELLIRALGASDQSKETIGHSVRVELAFDGTRIYQRIVDPLGSFSRDIMLRHIVSLDSHQENNEFRHGDERHASSRDALCKYQRAMIHIYPDRKTEVVSIYRLQRSLRDGPPMPVSLECYRW